MVSKYTILNNSKLKFNYLAGLTLYSAIIHYAFEATLCVQYINVLFSIVV